MRSPLFTRVAAVALLLALGGPVAAQDGGADAGVIQQVLTATNQGGELDAQEALDALRTDLLDLNADERGFLSDFSLETQGNLTLLRQEGAENDASVVQRGAGNVAVLVQTGTNLTAGVVQEGSGNVFGVDLEGDDLLLGEIVQQGDGNVYLLEYRGSALEIAPAVQVGQQNQAIQVGAIEQPFGVQQYGNGLNMIIRHNGGQ